MQKINNKDYNKFESLVLMTLKECLNFKLNN